MPELAWQTVAYMRQGGWVMVPLAAVSLVLWTLIVERFRTYRSLDGGLRDHLSDAFAGIRTGRSDVDRELLGLCARRLHRTIERYLAIIMMLAGVAPLLGLLGTVLGMIQTFDVIAIFGTGNAQALAGGISVALITTQAGLLIAIPGLFLSGRLRRQAAGLAIRLDEARALLDRQLAGGALASPTLALSDPTERPQP